MHVFNNAATIIGEESFECFVTRISTLGFVTTNSVKDKLYRNFYMNTDPAYDFFTSTRHSIIT